jgi:cystathionine beta-lyase
MGKIDQENTITMNSPSKSFNIAGLEISNIITSNPGWRKLIDRVINIWEHCDLNPFGVLALQAAYDEGEDWLKELNEYLYDNYKALVSYFEDVVPEILVSKLEGTYLVWIDVRCLGMKSTEIEKSLIENEHVRLSPGEIYGRDGFMRINIACPRTRLLQGLERIAKGFKRMMGK